MEITPIKGMLDLGITPVLYGDAVPDEKKGISILSGDQIVVYLAKKLNSSRVVLGVDVDGVFAANPKKEEEPMLVKKITLADRKLVDLLGTAGSDDVTGGMKKKVEELLELAKQGVEAEIVNATKPNFLKKAVNGESGLGTIICRR